MRHKQEAQDAQQATAGQLSSRADKLLNSQGSFYYFPGVLKALQGGIWSRQNPEGYCVVAVAENRQTIDVLQERLARCAPIPRQAFFYDDFAGVLRIRTATAKYLERTFMKGLTIDPANIIVQTGCGAILNNMFALMCEPGDGILVPAPYYPGFDSDMKALAHVQPVPVWLPEQGSVAQTLDDAVAAAVEANHPVKALLLTNPNNPLGSIYPSETLKELISWCVARGIHLISDEVYANSVFGEGAHFVSVANLVEELFAGLLEDSDRLRDLVHVVFGVSKDFCASGFRVGFLHTKNPELLKTMAGSGYFAGVSNIVQHLISELFEDEAFLESYLAENARRLGASYKTFVGAMEKAGIPYVPAVGAMSVWFDLRRGLAAPTWEAERQLWTDLVDQQKVVLTPGECCHAAEPGWFRACYAWMEDESALDAMVGRIVAHIGSAPQ